MTNKKKCMNQIQFELFLFFLDTEILHIQDQTTTAFGRVRSKSPFVAFEKL